MSANSEQGSKSRYPYKQEVHFNSGFECNPKIRATYMLYGKCHIYHRIIMFMYGNMKSFVHKVRKVRQQELKHIIQQESKTNPRVKTRAKNRDRREAKIFMERRILPRGSDYDVAHA